MSICLSKGPICENTYLERAEMKSAMKHIRDSLPCGRKHLDLSCTLLAPSVHSGQPSEVSGHTREHELRRCLATPASFSHPSHHFLPSSSPLAATVVNLPTPWRNRAQFGAKAAPPPLRWQGRIRREPRGARPLTCQGTRSPSSDAPPSGSGLTFFFSSWAPSAPPSPSRLSSPSLRRISSPHLCRH
jgi:hypothetical protein